ncbi:DUF1080 domain-containing protein [Aquimarina sp. RZ0]|uniref:3-keto-disaccharide hydrolase n=1 Tax=Aquimarina sp. RZ0 TaxID=2607730 RepID=UPI0011F23580|nr:DUF1080 domain-containing protein [Aquimarina sp. RZ0]KAA1246502.1 DUF1080 domain-containing protein [Aquimarina sp. RZ0]
MGKKSITTLVLLVLVTLLTLSLTRKKEEKWVPIFNGKDLTNWTIKVAGHKIGQNYKNTFRVEDGMLKVSYDDYNKFDNDFAHIFYNEKLTNYRIKVEYRFVGDQLEGGPWWGFLNSGIMIHCESPETMELDQAFPTSIEAQLLSSDNAKEEKFKDRPTGSVCTPGTHIVINKELITEHCTLSNSKPFKKGEWITAEVEVNDGVFKHFANGELVLEYSDAILDEKDAHTAKLIADGASIKLTSGYVALQGESHPLDIRKIELLKLD